MNYYNEFDPHAAAWLRQLIAEGLIPQGEVDQRSITDVRAADLSGFTQCHFFAGIAGWSFALELAGWPADRPVWTGSCPCQPFSVAGKGKGTADERHLWPDFFRLIRECRPPIVIGEQVTSPAALGWLDGVFDDLERERYACGAVPLGAFSVSAPHQRRRLYWAANAGHESTRRPAGSGEAEGRGALGDFAGRGDVNALANAAGARCDWQVQGAEGEARHETRVLVSGAGEPACAMADRLSTGLEGLARNGGGGNESRRLDTLPAGPTSQGGGDGGMEHPESDGRIERRPESGGRSTLSRCPWDDFQLILCRDGKLRRIPAQSVFQRMADGIPAGVDAGWADLFTEAETGGIAAAAGGFPLAQKIPHRVPLLKGFGNAIVPQTAALFIEAFAGIEYEQGRPRF